MSSYWFLNQTSYSLFSKTPRPKLVHTTMKLEKRNPGSSNRLTSWYLSEGLLRT